MRLITLASLTLLSLIGCGSGTVTELGTGDRGTGRVATVGSSDTGTMGSNTGVAMATGSSSGSIGSAPTSSAGTGASSSTGGGRSSAATSSGTSGRNRTSGTAPGTGGRSSAGGVGSAAGGGVPASLCIGGQLYALGDHDEFDQDSTLSVSDSWPPPSGTEWSNRYQWGRTNNPGGDDAYYPSLADLGSWGLKPVATLKPGVGLALTAYPVPTPIPDGERTTLCADGTCRGHLSGVLSNANAHTNGYWVYSVQLPAGNGWWPAVWELNETTTGCYDELDNLEQWSPDVFGPGVVAQTEQPSGGACTSGKAHGQQTIVATSDSALHT